MGFLGIDKVFDKVVNGKKCEGAVLQEKKLYLRLWKFNDLKELCNEKGIAVKEKNLDGNNNLQERDLSFYELVEVVAKTINSKEICFFAKNKGIAFEEFEKKLATIKQFYGVQ